MTKLTDSGAFFATLRTSRLLGASIEQSEVDGCNAVLAACGSDGWGPKWTAYALATAYHETAGTMLPIREYGSNQYLTMNYDITGNNPARARKMGNTAAGDGVRYCGRGYVQLTWKNNYAKAERELDEPFVAEPTLAMRPDLAAKIMVRGMREGWFTGKNLGHYITVANVDYVNARRVINGTDKAAKIAGHAKIFQAALEAGGWG